MRTLILIIASLLLSSPGFAQKKELLQDKEVILARADQVLDAAMRPEGFLYEAIVKEDLKGRYVLQVSFRDKGDISSVFVVSAEEGDLRSQNRFKDLVHLSSMPFKMPKGRQYRIEHTFDLNAISR